MKKEFISSLKNIEEKDKDKIDFVYDSAIYCSNKIDDDIKTSSTRFTWLLGILVFTLSSLAPFAFDDFILLPTSEMLETEEGRLKVFAKLFSIICFANIIIFAKNIISSNLGKHVYNDPRKFLTKEVFSQSTMEIKIFALENLQNKIDHSDKKLKALNSDLYFLIMNIAICLISIITLIWYFAT